MVRDHRANKMNFAIMIIAYLVDFVNRLWYNKEKWEG